MQLRTPRRLPDAPAPACNDRQNTSAQTSQANNKRTARSLKRKLQGQPWCTGLDEKNTLAHQELNCQDRSPCRTWRDGERTEELAPASLTTHLPISSTQPPPQLKSRASEASNCGNTTGYGSGRCWQYQCQICRLPRVGGGCLAHPGGGYPAAGALASSKPPATFPPP